MVQTNNSYLSDKVALRMNHIPDKERLRVLDCYGGEGKIWTAVKKLTGRKITVLPIEIKEYNNASFHLPGDNRSYLQTLDLSKFDVIDLDAYGTPIEQLETLFERNYKGVVFVTFIQSIMGMLPYVLLRAVGFTDEMVKKCPTLFGKSGWKYFCEYLSLRGVKTIWHRYHARKHYIGFSCAGQSSAGCDNQQGGSLAGLF